MAKAYSEAMRVVSDVLSAMAMAGDLEGRQREALEIASVYGAIEDAHHKAWIIDQMVRALTGCTKETREGKDCHGKPYTYEMQYESEAYRRFVAEARDGDEGAETYEWDTGIAP